ncbi:MAG: lytic transglycosylase domain-containing protein, partial [Ottowia sp.]|nr:lytic transglycosylase domain-containing protein [Ottowia sp.]
ADKAFKKQKELGGDTWLSPETHESRVRNALLSGNWSSITQALEAMPIALRKRDPAWIYWYGRALEAQGKEAQARSQYQLLIASFHFYGQLARETLGQHITVPVDVSASEADIAAVKTRPGFARAQKFYALDLRFEANREWNWALRGMSDPELIAAAEYASRLKLFDRAVSTADRTRNEHNFSLRYVMPYHDLVSRVAQPLDLDIAWVYGLIRQESRFITSARSHVGAAGLMQVMPKTAHYVARKIGLANYTHGKIDQTDTNITLGVHYLNIVLHDLDGSWLLASAAYNAGPSRAKQWRANLNHPVEGAIFAEAIPLEETRTYVKNVLANATLYEALITGKPQSLRQRLGTIAPK